MRKFKEFKEGIVDMFIDMKEEDNDADYLVDWINEAKSLDCFTDLASMLVRISYWEPSDAIEYGKEVESV